MTKAATKWNPPVNGTISPDNAGVARLEESPELPRLQEDRTPRILENNVVYPREATVWVTQ